MKQTGPDSVASWLIAFYCSLISMLLYGVVRQSGALFVASMSHFHVDRQGASFPFVLSDFVQATAGPITGFLGLRYGIRPVVTFGSFLSTVGIGSCFLAEDIGTVTVLWGVVYGFGFGLSTLSLPVIITEHFATKRATAIGVVYVGAYVGLFILPSIVELLLENYGLSGTFLWMAGFVLHCVPLSMLLRDSDATTNVSKTSSDSKFINNKRNKSSLNVINDPVDISVSSEKKRNYPNLNGYAKCKCKFPRTEVEGNNNKGFQFEEEIKHQTKESTHKDLSGEIDDKKHNNQTNETLETNLNCDISKSSTLHRKFFLSGNTFRRCAELFSFSSKQIRNQAVENLPSYKESGDVFKNNEIHLVSENIQVCDQFKIECSNMDSNFMNSVTEPFKNDSKNDMQVSDHQIRRRMGDDQKNEFFTETFLDSQFCESTSIECSNTESHDGFIETSEDLSSLSGSQGQNNKLENVSSDFRNCSSTIVNFSINGLKSPDSLIEQTVKRVPISDSCSMISANCSTFEKLGRTETSFSDSPTCVSKTLKLSNMESSIQFSIITEHSNKESKSHPSRTIKPLSKNLNSLICISEPSTNVLPISETGNMIRANPEKLIKNKMFASESPACNFVTTKPSDKDCKSHAFKTTSNSNSHELLKMFLEPIFILVLFSAAVFVGTFIAFVTVVVDFTRDIGLLISDGTYVLMIFSMASAVGLVSFGWVTDRGHMTETNLSGVMFLLRSVTLFIIPFSNGFIMLLAAVAIQGFCESSLANLLPLIVAEYYVEDIHKMAISSVLFMSGPMYLVTPLVIGYFRDGLGSYLYLFFSMGVLSLVCSILMLLAPVLAKCRCGRGDEILRKRNPEQLECC